MEDGVPDVLPAVAGLEDRAAAILGLSEVEAFVQEHVDRAYVLVRTRQPRVEVGVLRQRVGSCVTELRANHSGPREQAQQTGQRDDVRRGAADQHDGHPVLPGLTAPRRKQVASTPNDTPARSRLEPGVTPACGQETLLRMNEQLSSFLTGTLRWPPVFTASTHQPVQVSPQCKPEDPLVKESRCPHGTC